VGANPSLPRKTVELAEDWRRVAQTQRWRLSVQVVLGQRAARRQTVQVHVLAQALAPGVQHRGQAQLSPQAFRVEPEGLQRLPDATKQRPVDHLGVGLHPGVEPVGQR